MTLNHALTGSKLWMVMELSFWERYYFQKESFKVILIFSRQTCGTNKPAAAIKSNTNEAKIEFHSDPHFINDKVSGTSDVKAPI